MGSNKKFQMEGGSYGDGFVAPAPVPDPARWKGGRLESGVGMV